MIRDYRDKAQGLTDLLGYAMMIDDGVILNKDGSLLAGWQLRGHDLNSSSARELERISAQINRTLCQLGDGWMIHSDLLRVESRDYPLKEQCAFPNPTSRLIDQERRQQYLAEGAHFESILRLVMTYRTPPEIESKLSKLFIEGAPKGQHGWEKVVTMFNDKLAYIENSLSIALNTLERLSSEALLSHLHSCITGKYHRLCLPKIPVYLDTLLGTHDFFGGIYPKIGEHFIRPISITGLPLETEPGILSLLDSLPLAFRWSNRFIFLDPSSAVREIKKYSDKWMQKRQGLKGLIKEIMSGGVNVFDQNQDAVTMSMDARDAIEEAQSSLVRFGFYTSTLVLMGEHPEELDENAKLIIKNLELRGFEGRIETINAIEAYMGTLPGHGYQNVRRPLINTLNIADLLPLSSVWAGLQQNPCRYFPPHSPPLLYAATSGATPFRLNLHVDDVGHACVFGGTGKGKSTLILSLIAQFFRYPKAQVFLFDKGLSSYPLVKALGGAHYSLASDDDTLSLVPLQHIDSDNELDTACDWIELCMECQGKPANDQHRKAIRRALLHLRQQEKRSLTHFQSTVQNQEVKDAMAPYTLAGSMGKVLDAESCHLSNAPFQVFEMQELLKKGPASFLPTIIHLFNSIEKRLKANRPTLIIIEEGHNFLQGRFGAQLETWYAEKRKENVSVIFVDQTLTKLLNSKYAHVLLNNVSTKIFLPNPDADTSLNKSAYQALDLTDRQVDIIKSALEKRQYYIVSSQGKRLIDLGLGKVILSFVGVDSVQDRKKVDELIDRYGDVWVYHWLIHRGLPSWAEYWQSLYQDHSQGTLRHACA